MNKKLLVIILALITVISCSSCKNDEVYVQNPKPDELVIGLDDMLQYANDTWTMTELLSELYPDYAFYSDASGLLTAEPKNKTLRVSDYDFSKITKDDNGFKVYDKRSSEKKSWKGIDVSSFQGVIDWEKVAACGVDFVFVRIGYRGYSEGVLQFDQMYRENIEGALANGIQVGVYFVTQAISEEEAAEEAQWVMEAIKPYDITWPIVYDIEGSNSKEARARKNTADQNTKNIKAFCKCIKDGGYTPMIYSNTRWLISEMHIAELQDYDVWFAFYNDHPFYPYHYQVWQYSETGMIDGVTGFVDQDISFVDYGKK